MEHLTDDQLEAFVQGERLADEARLRTHVAACSACAKRLEREAQLERLLPALAAKARVRVTARLPFGVPLAAAATLALLLGGGWLLLWGWKLRQFSFGASGWPPASASADAMAGFDVMLPQDYGLDANVPLGPPPPADGMIRFVPR